MHTLTLIKKRTHCTHTHTKNTHTVHTHTKRTHKNTHTAHTHTQNAHTNTHTTCSLDPPTLDRPFSGPRQAQQDQNKTYTRVYRVSMVQ